MLEKVGGNKDNTTRTIIYMVCVQQRPVLSPLMYHNTESQ